MKTWVEGSLTLPADRKLVFVCIGTDRSTGDSYGPLVGTFLQMMDPSLKVYGTLEMPVHADNIKEILNHIYEECENPFIVAVDSELVIRRGLIGRIKISPGPIKPGTAVGKDLPEVGDVSITGAVNMGGFLNYFVLQSTRLHNVFQMSAVTAEEILLALQKQRRLLCGGC